jgi:GDSL-like lipase/acylhydrolase family protein
MIAPLWPVAHRRAALGVFVAAGLEAAAGPVPPKTARPSGAGHIVLLGDSVFDNKAYVGDEPDVSAHLRAHLPAQWRTTLAAVDGAVASNVGRQLAQVPMDATHLVISVGGNDALQHESVLGAGARNVGEGLARLADVREHFQRDYEAMLGSVLARDLPTAVCTIYDPRFADPVRQKLGLAGLTLFNDVITRAAFAQGLPLLDLRLVCDEAADFANPIEPSGQGGRKIAGTIMHLVSEHDFTRHRSEIFTGRPGT